MKSERTRFFRRGWLGTAIIACTCIGCGGVDDTPPGQFMLDGEVWTLIDSAPDSAVTVMKVAVTSNDELHEMIRTSEPQATYGNAGSEAFRFYWTFVDDDVVNWFFIEVEADGELAGMGSGLPMPASPP